MAKINLDALSVSERAAVEARREYQRKWRAENKEKVREHNKRFWDKKAAEMAAATSK